MNLLHAGKQEYNNYTVARHPEGIHGKGMHTERCAFASAKEPGCG
jgi:hypothetical protein